jgi:signal peptidase I
VQSPEFLFYLKRCIGLAGDTIEVRNRVVYVNNVRAPVPRNVKFNTMNVIPPGHPDPRIFPVGSPYNEDNWGPMRIPRKGDVIALSDSSIVAWATFIGREGHSVSIESRGQILVDGKPADTYTVEHNYLFGMGDNRDNSLDGRFWGFISEDAIIGTPMIVYWSWSPDIPLISIVDKLRSIRFDRIGTLIR